MRALALTVALSGLLFSSSFGAAAAARSPITHTVTIEGTSFTPSTLTVKAGDTIVWINQDPFPHTVTSKDGGFDSGALQPDKSWKLTPAKKGDFSYVCVLHPTMKATLRVE
jgi:plastocyanin